MNGRHRINTRAIINAIIAQNAEIAIGHLSCLYSLSEAVYPHAEHSSLPYGRSGRVGVGGFSMPGGGVLDCFLLIFFPRK